MLPGPEEYFNGGMESGDAALRRPLQVGDRAGATRRARDGEHHVQQVRGRTHVHRGAVPQHSQRHHARRIDRRGRVGRCCLPVGPERGHLRRRRWSRLGSPSISDDGTKIAASAVDTDGTVRPAISENGVWTVLPPVPGSIPCDQDGPRRAAAAFDISGTARRWSGMNYGDGCFRGESERSSGRPPAGASRSRNPARSTTCRAPPLSTTTDR